MAAFHRLRLQLRRAALRMDVWICVVCSLKKSLYIPNASLFFALKTCFRAVRVHCCCIYLCVLITEAKTEVLPFAHPDTPNPKILDDSYKNETTLKELIVLHLLI